MIVSLSCSLVNAELLKEYIRSILEIKTCLTVSEQASDVKSLSNLVPVGVIFFKRSGGRR